MVELSKKDIKLDLVFAALADHSRRQILVRLRKEPLTISEIAEPFSMSFAGVAKHIEVLTQAGLVRKKRSSNDGRSFKLELQRNSFAEASAWIKYHQEFWSNKLDRLESFIEEQDDDHRNPKSRKKN